MKIPFTRGRTERPREPLLQLDTDFRVNLRRIGGRLRTRISGFGGANLEIPPWLTWKSNLRPTERVPGGEQCLVGSLTGAVASKNVTEAREGSLSLIGNQAQSVMA